MPQGSAQGVTFIVTPMTDLFRDMDHQWRHDGRSRAARAALTRWSGRQPDLGRFASPAELVAAAHDRTDAAARDDLEGLTHEAATDPLAARTVLQALVPGLTCLAHDNARMVGDDTQPFASSEELDQFLACTAFQRITEVAAEADRFRLRIVLDSTWARLRSYARAHHRDQDRHLTFDDDVATDAPAPPARTPAEELAMLLVDVVERGVLRDIDAGVVYTTRVAGHSPAEVAAVLRWNPTAVYQRRRRSESVLRADALGQPRPAYCLRSA